MAVKLLDLSSLVRTLEIADGFTVSVKYLARPTLLALARRAESLSIEDAAAAWAAATIDGWTGLTLPIARRTLNVPFDDEMANADGIIPYSKEAAAALWLYANADATAKIQAFAFKLLGTVEDEKAVAKNV